MKLLIDICLYYAKFKKKCTGLHIFLADLNIDHCVELTSLEADWVDFLY